MKSQSGFTLIEMVAVIVILAIMAATAMPKFTSLSGEARLSALNGMVGALDSARSLAKSKWVAQNSSVVANIDMGGTQVSVISGTGTYQGYPTGNTAGIWNALDNPTGFASATRTGAIVDFWPTGVTNSATCSVSYQSGVVTKVTAASLASACL